MRRSTAVLLVATIVLAFIGQGQAQVVFRPPLQVPIQTMEDFLPSIEYSTFTFTPAQIRALFSAPQTLIPAEVNVANVPISIDFYKEAGDAYNAAASGNLRVMAGARVYAINYAATTLLNNTGATKIFAQNIGNNGTAATDVLVKYAATDFTNTAVIMSFSAADATDGTGNMVVTIFWRSWTVAPIITP